MQYALLIHENEAEAYPGGEDDPAFMEVFHAHLAFAGELVQAGVMRGGWGLHKTNTATTLRVSGGQGSLHDGPFAETREQLGGLYIIEAADLDEAVAWARKLPMPPAGGSVEIRPCLDTPDEM